MRLVTIESCAPGMKLGKAVLTEHGQVLLGYGYELTQPVILRLRNMGIHQLYIDDPRTDDIVVEETIREETRRLVHGSLQQCMDYVRAGGPAGGGRVVTFSRLVSDSVNSIVDDVVLNRNMPIVHIRSTAATGDKLEHHFVNNALNVSVFATKLAMAEGASADELRTVCAAALFHDIGKLLVPQELLSKRTRLSDEDLRTLRRHAELGYRLLKNDGSVSLVAAQCALQHHERVDGLGYPFGLRGSDIHPYAKLIGMIDAYDALVSHRSYRNAMLPHEAMDYLYANVESAYDRGKVEQFRNKVAIFPPGTAVTLNTGEKGVVSRLDSSCLQRPTIRVLTNPNGEELKTPYELQLAKHLNIMIRSVGDIRSYAG
ncbi:HD domain-containing phosphohydrolase [Paenibacillus sp.]|uniref:HD-GYP domain-containing protein n=1 Tax=Paenibacillus sp. TaxID=58172 RepID=UPI0028125BFA|nr:HD domain-containing phosphohydrolase [Paenibacillus sp.]